MVSTQVEKVPLGRSIVRWDNITANSTVYEKLVAAPSDDDLRLMWLLSSIIDFLASAFIATITVAILANRKTRRNPFNLLLIVVFLPDLWFSFQCALTCTLNAIAGHYYSAAMCRWQGLYVIFNIAANSWLNAIIAHEVYRMLRASLIRKRYFPPKRCCIAKMSLGIYAWSGFLASWSITSIDWIPQHFDAHFGFVCLPLESTEHCMVFMWACFFPLLFGIPYLYVLWVFYDIFFRSKLLPSKGRHKALSIYFVRIIIAFLIMWLPALTVFFGLRGQASPWVKWTFGMWAHLQGVVSAAIALAKKDVKHAATRLITLKACVPEADDRHDGLQASSLGSAFFPWIPKVKSQLARSDCIVGRSKSDHGPSQSIRDDDVELEEMGDNVACQPEQSQYQDVEVQAANTTLCPIHEKPETEHRVQRG